MMNTQCVICSKPSEEKLTTLTQQGINTILEFAAHYNDLSLES
jgi:hypothetical protein